jgi:dTDP-6-deoxy-L-talose 4-dehydrogenase (NAD+)
MKVAVTGGSGFIGRHVVSELRRHDLAPLLAVRPGSSVPDELATLPAVEIDVADPPADSFRRLDSPDVLVHLAWDGLPNYGSVHHLEQLAGQTAFLGTMLRDGLQGLLVAGTCLEYGLQSGALSEDLPTAPVTAYGQAKDRLRAALEALRAVRPYHLTWARLLYLHGPGQAAGSLIPQLEAAMARGDDAFDMSGGEQQRDYLPVEEAARYLVELATNGRDNGVVNVCSGTPVTVRDLVESTVRARGAELRLNLGRHPYPDYEPMAFWGDRTRLDRLVGTPA